MVEHRIVLSSKVVAELKKNSDGVSGFGLYPSRLSHLEKIKGLKQEIFNFDVLGLDYWEIFSVDNSDWVQANSYFFNSEFDRASEKLVGNFENTVGFLLLNGLPMLLKEGIKTYLGCQLEPVTITENDFIQMPVTSTTILRTITPAGGILVKNSPSWFMDNLKGFQALLTEIEIKMQVDDTPGMRIVSMDEFMAEMEKKFK